MLNDTNIYCAVSQSSRHTWCSAGYCFYTLLFLHAIVLHLFIVCLLFYTCLLSACCSVSLFIFKNLWDKIKIIKFNLLSIFPKISLNASTTMYCSILQSCCILVLVPADYFSFAQMFFL